MDSCLNVTRVIIKKQQPYSSLEDLDQSGLRCPECDVSAEAWRVETYLKGTTFSVSTSVFTPSGRNPTPELVTDEKSELFYATNLREKKNYLSIIDF